LDFLHQFADGLGGVKPAVGSSTSDRLLECCRLVS